MCTTIKGQHLIQCISNTTHAIQRTDTSVQGQLIHVSAMHHDAPNHCKYNFMSHTSADTALATVLCIPTSVNQYVRTIARVHGSNTVNETEERKRCVGLLGQVVNPSVGSGKHERWLDLRFSWETAPAPVVLSAHASNIPAFTPCSLNHDLFEHLLHTHPDPLSVALLLDTIRNGANIAFDGDRTVTQVSSNMPSVKQHTQAISDAIGKDMTAGFISQPFPTSSPPFAHYRSCPLGVIVKQVGNKSKVRIIKNLSAPYGNSVNSHINKLSMQYMAFDGAVDAVVGAGVGCLMSKIDIKDAFRLVKVRYADWPLLMFQWLNSFYFDMALPFGLRSSPPIWDRVASKLHYLFSLMYWYCCYWVDDFFFISHSQCTHHHSYTSFTPFLLNSTHTHALVESSCHQPSIANAKRQLAMVLLLLQHLHVPTADDKVEGPLHVMVYLGIIIDSITMTSTLPDDKKVKTLNLIKSVLSHKSISIDVYYSLCGQLQHVCKVLPQGRPFLQRMYQAIAKSQQHTHVFLSDEIRLDLMFWQQLLPMWNGVSLMYKQPWLNIDTLQCFTDASQWGQGGVFGNEWFSMKWTEQQKHAAQRDQKESMPYYELHAIFTCVAIWATQFSHHRLILNCDCLPVVHALTTGHTRSPHMSELLRCITRLSIAHHFLLRPQHLAGVKNVYADHLSRNNVDAYIQTSGSFHHFRKHLPLGVTMPSYSK